jgi:Fic family protein
LIVANTAAMDAAIALADALDAESILAMHRALLEETHPEMAGRWRSEQVWIGGGDVGPHHADFVPPHHANVEAAIDDLVEFMARDDLPVIVHAALAHAQFETIHPFPDGNGRTGRALMHAFLRNKRVTRTVTVPVSAGLLATTQSYFTALTAYRSGDVEPIVAQVSAAVLRSVESGRRLVDRLHSIRDSWTTRIHARSDALAWRVADLIVRHPVIDAPFTAARLGVPITNIHRAIAPLEHAGVLTEFTDRPRNRVWRSAEVLEALDDFAAQSMRRG